MAQIQKYIKAASLQTLAYAGILFITLGAIVGFFVWALLFHIRVITPLRYSPDESPPPASVINFTAFDPVANKLNLPWPPEEEAQQ